MIENLKRVQETRENCQIILLSKHKRAESDAFTPSPDDCCCRLERTCIFLEQNHPGIRKEGWEGVCTVFTKRYLAL